MDVTTTSTKIGKFDARFFHLIFEEEFAKVFIVHALVTCQCFWRDSRKSTKLDE